MKRNGSIKKNTFDSGNTDKIHWGEKWEKMKFQIPPLRYEYEISNSGRLKRNDPESGESKIMKPMITKDTKVKRVNIKLQERNGKNKGTSIYIHKAVGEYFVKGKDELKKQILHLDGDKLNNHWKNLKWVTFKELRAIQVKNGVYPSLMPGYKKGSKLTETKVRKLKMILKRGKTKKKIIARKFGISERHVEQIQQGKTWGEIKID